MSDDQITIRDYGATISLRFGDQAREIVASIPSEAVKVLARMMFAEHARAEKLAAALLRLDALHRDEYDPEAVDMVQRPAWLAEALALATHEASEKETT